MPIVFLDFSGQTTSEKHCFVLFCAGLNSLNVDRTNRVYTKSPEFAYFPLSKKLKRHYKENYWPDLDADCIFGFLRPNYVRKTLLRVVLCRIRQFKCRSYRPGTHKIPWICIFATVKKVKTQLKGKLLARSGCRLYFWISQAKLRQKNSISCCFVQD